MNEKHTNMQTWSNRNEKSYEEKWKKKRKKYIKIWKQKVTDVKVWLTYPHGCTEGQRKEKN